MFTTRMRPKISVKPLATTKNSAESVIPLSVTDGELVEVAGPLDEQPADHQKGGGAKENRGHALRSGKGFHGGISGRGLVTPKRDTHRLDTY